MKQTINVGEIGFGRLLDALNKPPNPTQKLINLMAGKPKYEFGIYHTYWDDENGLVTKQVAPEDFYKPAIK